MNMNGFQELERPTSLVFSFGGTTRTPLPSNNSSIFLTPVTPGGTSTFGFFGSYEFERRQKVYRVKRPLDTPYWNEKDVDCMSPSPKLVTVELGHDADVIDENGFLLDQTFEQCSSHLVNQDDDDIELVEDEWGSLITKKVYLERIAKYGIDEICPTSSSSLGPPKVKQAKRRLTPAQNSDFPMIEIESGPEFTAAFSNNGTGPTNTNPSYNRC